MRASNDPAWGDVENRRAAQAASRGRPDRHYVTYDYSYAMAITGFVDFLEQRLQMGLGNTS
ncbi:hypothetical protein ACFRU3_28415 [Streptomyces sp. NPDC056910]|uniref:hypothetical protein n=1 Tax=Streptomyces sp. NPDC056910 TaxID=3345964 RepID=UPI0036B94E21